MRAVVTCTVLASLFFTIPAQAREVQSTSVRTTIEAINQAGFADFATYGTDASNILLSPVLTWYVHRALSLHSRDAQARTLLEQLRQSGVVIDTTIHAARGRSEYTDAVASYESADLGAATLWDQPRGPGDYAWTIDIEIHTNDVLSDRYSADPDMQYLQAPFYARDSIRAVRFNAADGSRSLFVFWGTHAVLSDFRQRMSSSLWRSVCNDFAAESGVMISDFALHRRMIASLPVASSEGFGSFRFPMYPRYGTTDNSFVATLGEARTHLRAGVQGYAMPERGAISPHDAPPSIDYVVIPPERRISAIVPMLYVLQDTQSGTILLMGENG